MGYSAYARAADNMARSLESQAKDLRQLSDDLGFLEDRDAVELARRARELVDAVEELERAMGRGETESPLNLAQQWAHRDAYEAAAIMRAFLRRQA